MQKQPFLQGVAVGAGIVILLVGIYYAGSLNSGGAKVAANTNQPTDTVPDPTQPTADVTKVKVTSEDHIRGDKNAKLTMIVFSDFECPFCAKFNPTIDQVLKDYSGKVRIIYKHFPLSFHPQAQKAAEASECASEQGKFWEMHDALFAMNEAGTLSLDNFKAKAKDLGLDTAKFNTCLDNGTMAAKVAANYQEGLAAGINGTPGSFVGTQFIAGAVPFATIQQLIDSQL